MKSKNDIALIMSETFKRLDTLREAGQKEYAHTDDNAFANFERVATDLGLSREQVLWVYLRKHLDGIVSYIKGHRSQRESVHGRIDDAHVYLELLRGMIIDNENQANMDHVIEHTFMEPQVATPIKGLPCICSGLQHDPNNPNCTRNQAWAVGRT